MTDIKTSSTNLISEIHNTSNANEVELKNQWNKLTLDYRLQLIEAFKYIQQNNEGKPVATIKIINKEIKIHLGKFIETKKGNISNIPIEFILNEKKQTVNVNFDIYSYNKTLIDVQNFKFSPLVIRLSLPFSGSKVKYNVSQLLEPGEGDQNTLQVTWRSQENILDWGTKEVPDLSKYVKKWYANNDKTNLQFEGALKNIRISLKDRKFNIDLKDNDSTEYSLNLPLETTHLKYISNIHACTLIARAIDWIVFATFDPDTFFDIIEDNKIQSGNPATLLDLIQPDEYNLNPARPVDLSPFKLKEIAETDNLYFSWNVYQTVCASLNLGRHLILTGPPGCGKSELATLVARLIATNSGNEGALAEPKVVTASPSWTSGDIIGRYFPYPPSGSLRFQPGIFLQALVEDRCLVIDEMNRANLDECFGELFTVLAGHAVDLPYSEEIENEKKDGVSLAAVRIVPRKSSGVTPSDRVCYTMSQTFRLIGTMNDADRSALHQLSFALLRRFDVVRVDPPSKNDLIKLLGKNLPAANDINIYTFRAVNNVRDPRVAVRSHIIKLIESLFLDEDQGLIMSYVVGVATLLDVIKFIFEGIRKNDSDNVDISKIVGDDPKEKILQFVTSLTSLAIILTVVPQLDALDEVQFEKTIRHLKNCLGQTPYIRINQDEFGLHLIQEGKSTVSSFLFDEIGRATRGTQRFQIIQKVHPLPYED